MCEKANNKYINEIKNYVLGVRVGRTVDGVSKFCDLIRTPFSSREGGGRRIRRSRRMRRKGRSKGGGEMFLTDVTTNVVFYCIYTFT